MDDRGSSVYRRKHVAYRGGKELRSTVFSQIRGEHQVLKIAINGFGRVGRNIVRAVYEMGYRDRIQLVAINDLGKFEVHAHLLQYDSAHGRFHLPVSTDGDTLMIGEDRIATFAQEDPAQLPWAGLGVDIVLECSGRFSSRDSAGKHLSAGAGKVLVSAPGKQLDVTVVHGVNDADLKPEHRLVSNASCTTNCLAPVALALHEALGIDAGVMTTVHAVTNDQVLLDKYHEDLRRARAATASMIPTKTGAAVAIGDVIPALAGRLDGLAVRVPVLNTSLLDLSVTVLRDTSRDEVNEIIRAAAADPRYCGVLSWTDQPLVSCDFNHHPASSIVDLGNTYVKGRLLKVLAWYDNEWAFSIRMLDNALNMGPLPAGN
jgi:glyceraldehyde 3-phosphate dehydrogenase